ncbi:hypothetical protein ACJBU6_01948 [Exserohilum turcicum]
MSRYYSSRDYQQPFDSAFSHSQRQYHVQVPQLRVSTAEQTQQWDPSVRPRSVQDMREQTYSPTASVHTTGTSPNTRLADRAFYSHSNLFPNTYVNPSLQGGSSMLTPDYISRGFNPSAQEESWSSFNMRSTENRVVRTPPRAVLSDEGYFSQQTSQSVLGNAPDRASQDLTIDFLSQIGHMNVDSTVSEATVSHVASDQKSRVSSTRSRRSSNRPTKCEYPDCNEIFRCPSEYKKHSLKHEKPFKCDAPKCRRTEVGFATVNDLDRHRKSVHSIDLDHKSYKCAAKNCKSKDKLWPRLDNFKQHVHRMHAEEDAADIIERSKWCPEKLPYSIIEESAVMPMDTNLVLSGMEKSFSTNADMRNISSLDFSSQQDSQQWNPADWKLDPTKEGHRISHNPSERVSANQTAASQRLQRVQRRAAALSAQQAQTSPPVTAMNIAPKENVPQVAKLKIDHHLSNAPQTKAEQQRLAQKRSVAKTSSLNAVDLSNLILNIIQKANGSGKQDEKSIENVPLGPETLSDSERVILTKRGVLEASQEIMKLISQNSEPVQRALRRSGKSRACPIDGCGFTVARDCELRKHMKRHERPYGCTYPQCDKRFGAKSDWKRHENSQHYQLEAFRCAHELSPGAVCGFHAHRRGPFLDHIETHGLSDKDSQDLVERSTIGTNCQGSFWCGFCTAVIRLTKERNKAWDERFRHIAHHLEQEKKNIGDWVCAEVNKTKRELLEERMRENCNDGDEKEEDRDSDSATEEDSDNSPPPAPPPPPPPEREPWRPTSRDAVTLQPQAFGQDNSRKRAAPAALDAFYPSDRQKKTRTEIYRYCVRICAAHNAILKLILVVFMWERPV